MDAFGKSAIVLGAFVAIAAPVLVAYHHDITAARERVATQARVIDTPCGRIQYAVLGEGPPLLVVHGAGGGFDQGLDIAGSLAHAGFQVIAVSRFGYLDTPLPADASAQAQARAHACLLDALGIREAAVLGASAGASSAMQFAILFPERTRRLVLLVPATYVPRSGGAMSVKTPSGTVAAFGTALRYDFVFWALLRAWPSLATRAILGTPPEVVTHASPAEQARVARVMGHILPVSSRRNGLLNDAAVISSLQRFELERIASPVLIVSAQDDYYGTWDCARYTAEQIPGARFIGYASGGHLLVGHDSAQAAEVADFLR
jgi:2-hydroxy-6-oxonona-2,4-dienedioate hydrolase